MWHIGHMKQIITPAEARKAASITLHALSALSHVSMSTIQRAERTGRWPHSRVIAEAMQKALGVANG